MEVTFHLSAEGSSSSSSSSSYPTAQINSSQEGSSLFPSTTGPLQQQQQMQTSVNTDSPPPSDAFASVISAPPLSIPTGVGQLSNPNSRGFLTARQRPTELSLPMLHDTTTAAATPTFFSAASGATMDSVAVSAGQQPPLHQGQHFIAASVVPRGLNGGKELPSEPTPLGKASGVGNLPVRCSDEPAASPVAHGSPPSSPLIRNPTGGLFASFPAMSSASRAASSPAVPLGRPNRLMTQNSHWGGGFSPTNPANTKPPLRPPPLPSGLGGDRVTRQATTSSAEWAAISSSTMSVQPPMAAGSGGERRGPSGEKLLSTVPADETSGDGGWWAAARRFVSDRTGQVNAYLEGIISPGNASKPVTPRMHRGSVIEPIGGGDAATAVAMAPAGASATAQMIDVGNPAPSGGVRAARANEPVHESAWAEPHREPFAADPSFSARLPPPLTIVVVDPSQGPFFGARRADEQLLITATSSNPHDDDLDANLNRSDSDCSMADEPTYVVDLVSALRGYQSSPTEPFGHLVAAALASRSLEQPVHGNEIIAADHSPFLVRLIVDSGVLDVDDPEVQRHVQETVDFLLPGNNIGELNPAIFEYLSSFFKMRFVRLNHSQYTVLKRGGFEYIKLMYDHQYVLPDENVRSILVNYSGTMHIINIVVMTLSLATIAFCSVSIAVTLASWMTVDHNAYQKYGFYTLIVYGAGYALYFIFLVYFVRSKQDERLYEPDQPGESTLGIPSPYSSVVPAVPVFDVACLIYYIRALRSKRLILGHNIMACSQISGICYSMWIGFPQLITQSYFNHVQVDIPSAYRNKWTFDLLRAAVILQWCFSLLRFAYGTVVYDSVDAFGFACFNNQKPPHVLERHTAIAHISYYVMAFLVETNIYLLITTAIALPSEECSTYMVWILALAAFSIFIIFIVYFALLLLEESSARISFTCLPVLATQVGICISSERVSRKSCSGIRRLFFRDSFAFGYLSWSAYFIVSVFWVLMMIQWLILYYRQVNLFPRVVWPYARRDDRFRESPGGLEENKSPSSASV